MVVSYFDCTWYLLVKPDKVVMPCSDAVSVIPGTQASRMANSSILYPGLGDKYIVSLDVFHILHCLVRQAFVRRE